MCTFYKTKCHVQWMGSLREVEENQYCEQAIIRILSDVITYIDESCCGTVTITETGMELMKEVMSVKVLVSLLECNFL